LQQTGQDDVKQATALADMAPGNSTYTSDSVVAVTTKSSSEGWESMRTNLLHCGPVKQSQYNLIAKHSELPTGS